MADERPTTLSPGMVLAGARVLFGHLNEHGRDAQDLAAEVYTAMFADCPVAPPTAFARRFGVTAQDCRDVAAMLGEDPEGCDERVAAMLDALAELLTDGR